MKPLPIFALLVLSLYSSGQQTLTSSDCSTLKYIKHTGAWLRGEVQVCSGDICLRPSQLGFDEQFDVVLRDKHGNKLVAKSLTYEQRKFCFEGRRDGDYQIALVLYEKGVSQPASNEVQAQSQQVKRRCVHD